MLKIHKGLYSSGAYWSNISFLFYPSVLLACLALASGGNRGLLLRLLVSIVFNFVFFSLILTIVLMSRPATIKKTLLRAIYIFQFSYLLISINHFLLYQQLIGLDSFYSLFDTDFHESTEYIKSNIKWSNLAISLIVSLPLLYACFRPSLSQVVATQPAWKLCALPLLFIFGITSFAVRNSKSYLTDYNPFLHVWTSVTIIAGEKSTIKKLYATMPQFNLKLEQDSAPTTHILVISESINRNHMSLYGYHRHTTPRLDKLVGSLYVMNDACSSRNHTIGALKELLTFASREDPAPLFNAPNILRLMHAAGFETYWVSNQQKVELGGSFLSIFSASADHTYFVNRRGWTEGVSLDEKLFKPLKNILSEKKEKKFIVVHLLGAHGGYDLRYPPSYEAFSKSEISKRFSKDYASYKRDPKKYNDYDNAILYADYIASELIAMQNPEANVTLTYISDHGEAVGEKDGMFGHGVDLPYRSMYEVPFFFWFSKPSQDRLQQRLENLKNNLSARYQSDQTIHSLLDLYNVKYPLIRRENSLFSTDFKSKNRYCDRLSPTEEKLEVKLVEQPG